MNGNLFLFASVATTKTTHGTTTPFKPRSLISTAAAASNVTIFHVSYWYRLLPLDNSAEKPTDGSNRSSHVRAIVSSLNVWVTTSVPTESVTPSILVLSLPLSLFHSGFWNGLWQLHGKSQVISNWLASLLTIYLTTRENAGYPTAPGWIVSLDNVILISVSTHTSC